MRLPAVVVALASAAVATACAGTRATEPTPVEEKPPSTAELLVAVAAGEATVAAASPAGKADSATVGGHRVVGRCDDAADVVHFTIAHVNDMQARWSDRLGGKSRYGFVAGYLRSLKDEVPESLVLDAGDDYEKGALAELRSMGEATRRMIQALPIDARTIGNHDFAYGADAVRRDVELSAHPVLSANVSGPFLPYVRVDVGCVKVGIVGLTTKSYGADDLPSDEPFDGVFAQDDRYVAVLDREVKAHRGEVDVMIALTHLGLSDDATLAARVPGIDLVVGGHSEDLLREPAPVARADRSRAWVLQAGRFAQTVGRADLSWESATRTLKIDRYRLVEIDERLPYANDVGELAARLEKQYAPDAHRPIAQLRADVAPGTPMADLVWRAAADRWGADALVVGRDVYWDKLRAGPVTLQSLYDTVLVQREPSGTSGFTSLWSVMLTGAELRALRPPVGGSFALFGPPASRVDPNRSYRLVIEKRALAAMPELESKHKPRFAGEVIDVVEAYARTRTSRGLTLD